MMKYLKNKITLFRTNPKLATFLGVSVVIFVFSLLLFTFTYLLPGAETVKAKEVSWNPKTREVIQEVHIANNGMVYLQGARVEDVSNNDVVVSTSWNNTKLNWTIQTNGVDYGARHFGTTFLNSKGKNGTIDDVEVGDIISVSGVFNIGYTELVVKADAIRF